MRILIVEDEKQLSEALVEIFMLNKYSVDAVFNGQDALDYIDAVEYDGIILDIMLPIIDGISVLKNIRKNKNSTPVLLLTAKSEIDDKVFGLDSGADDYLTKPFSTKELLARVRAMTRRETAVFHSNLSFGGVSIDRKNFEICFQDEKSALTNKEFQLMEMLMRNVGQYISSERFMEKVWGYDSDSEINVVWSHISSLRKKIELIGAKITIKSMRNLGYTLEELHDKKA